MRQRAVPLRACDNQRSCTVRALCCASCVPCLVCVSCAQLTWQAGLLAYPLDLRSICGL